jgi:hypothetical protein
MLYDVFWQRPLSSEGSVAWRKLFAGSRSFWKEAADAWFNFCDLGKVPL